MIFNKGRRTPPKFQPIRGALTGLGVLLGGVFIVEQRCSGFFFQNRTRLRGFRSSQVSRGVVGHSFNASETVFLGRILSINTRFSTWFCAGEV